MSTDLAIVFFTSLAATLNPTLLAAVIVKFLLPHPTRLMLGYLAGAYATSIASSIVLRPPPTAAVHSGRRRPPRWTARRPLGVS